jgi:hypothetical protein
LLINNKRKREGLETREKRSVHAAHAFFVLVFLFLNLLLSFKECLSILVDLQVSDKAVGGVDGNGVLLSYLPRGVR